LSGKGRLEEKGVSGQKFWTIYPKRVAKMVIGNGLLGERFEILRNETI